MVARALRDYESQQGRDWDTDWGDLDGRNRVMNGQPDRIVDPRGWVLWHHHWIKWWYRVAQPVWHEGRSQLKGSRLKSHLGRNSWPLNWATWISHKQYWWMVVECWRWWMCWIASAAPRTSLLTWRSFYRSYVVVALCLCDGVLYL